METVFKRGSFPSYTKRVHLFKRISNYGKKKTLLYKLWQTAVSKKLIEGTQKNNQEAIKYYFLLRK